MFKKCCCNGNDPSKNTCVCYWDYTYNGLGGRYNSTYPNDRGPKPSYFCRYADGHPELGWCFSICDNNLSITNPQDDSKDILRVEDGKIYTKCGEIKSCTVTTNTIANLPITNTLVPLAGKVNGNGFAFFCKGADGIKFYDGAFAVVDAGTATDVTYLVTTGV